MRFLLDIFWSGEQAAANQKQLEFLAPISNYHFFAAIGLTECAVLPERYCEANHNLGFEILRCDPTRTSPHDVILTRIPRGQGF